VPLPCCVCQAGPGRGAIVISTRTLQNRALHGDTVAVRLLAPADEEWEGEGEGEGEGAESGSKEEEDGGGPGGEGEPRGEGAVLEGGEEKGERGGSVCEGEVVGIVNRPERDLVSGPGG